MKNLRPLCMFKERHKYSRYCPHCGYNSKTKKSSIVSQKNYNKNKRKKKDIQNEKI